MHYTYLILLPIFLQVLYSTRKFPTKDYYFSKYIQFSTVYLILEQNLNTRNYPWQELIMEIFVLATDHDMNMHAKIQHMNMNIYFYKNTLWFYFVKFCTMLY
jgi:hypothetical protein